MKATAVIDSEGRIKIPRKIKEWLKLKPGSRVSLSVEDGVTKLSVSEPPLSNLVVCDGRLVIETTGSRPLSDEDVISAIKAGRDERESRILRGCR